MLLSNILLPEVHCNRPLHVSRGLWCVRLAVIGEICSFGLQLLRLLHVWSHNPGKMSSISHHWQAALLLVRELRPLHSLHCTWTPFDICTHELTIASHSRLCCDLFASKALNNLSFDDIMKLKKHYIDHFQPCLICSRCYMFDFIQQSRDNVGIEVEGKCPTGLRWPL